MPSAWANVTETLGVALLVAALVALLVLRDRRLHIVPLLLQYILVAGLIGPQLPPPFFIVRITLGSAISMILFITAFHTQRAIRREGGSALDFPRFGRLSPFTGRLFEGASLGLGVLLAFGLWSVYPIGNLALTIVLVAYQLAAIGLILALVSVEPLRIGIGLLFCLNGFEAIYFLFEKSLLAIALTSTLDLLVALAIAYHAEHWLRLMMRESRG